MCADCEGLWYISGRVHPRGMRIVHLMAEESRGNHMPNASQLASRLYFAHHHRCELSMRLH